MHSSQSLVKCPPLPVWRGWRRCICIRIKRRHDKVLAAIPEVTDKGRKPGCSPVTASRHHRTSRLDDLILRTAFP